MPCIKIKQLEERIATSGIHLGGTDARRKLEPGEVVFIPDDLLTDDKRVLFDLLWETGKIEISPDKPTRPLDYASYTEARLCSPSFTSRGPEDDESSEKARAAVTARLESDEPAPVQEVAAGYVEAPEVNLTPRVRRRAAAQAAHDGTQVNTRKITDRR